MPCSRDWSWKAYDLFCYKCWEPNPKYLKADCPKAQVCGKCAGDHDIHETGNCSNPPRCINCLSSPITPNGLPRDCNHAAFGPECQFPATIAMRENVRREQSRLWELENTLPIDVGNPPVGCDQSRGGPRQRQRGRQRSKKNGELELEDRRPRSQNSCAD
jgi:hypothetical protein